MKCAVHPEVDATGFVVTAAKRCAPFARVPFTKFSIAKIVWAQGMGVQLQLRRLPPPSLCCAGLCAARICSAVAAVPPPQIGKSSGAIAFNSRFYSPD